MKQPTVKKSSAWFWVGFALLLISAFIWVIFIAVIIAEGDTIWELILTGVIITVIPIGIGICGIRRGRIPMTPQWWAWTALNFFAILAIAGGIIGFIVAETTLVLVLSGLAVAIGLSLSAFAEERRRRPELGIKSLKMSGARLEIPSEDNGFATSSKAIFTFPDRNVAVDVVEEARSTGEKVSYTRIRVKYGGNMPCVIQIRNLVKRQIEFFEKDVYIEWIKEIGKEPQPYEPPLKVPKRVTIHGRRFSTALEKYTVPTAEQWVRDILGDSNVSMIQGTIRIEPSQVLWWRKGSMLPRQWLEDAIDGLVHLARKLELEKEH